MDKKVTRRVALGTVAVGLGGAIAAPYIISALKGGYKTTGLVGKRYEKDWESVVKLLDLPIKDTDGPPNVTLDYRPQVGTKSRVINIYGVYNEFNNVIGYPKSPDFYEIADGIITGISPILDSLPTLLINASNNFTNSRAFHKKEPNGEYMLVLNNDDYVFYERGKSNPKMLPLGKVDLSCALIGDAITFYYPKRKDLNIGMEWTIPETYRYCVQLGCKMVGFADIAGRKTVKMIAERQLNNQEVQHYITSVIQQEKQIEKDAGRSFNADQKMKSRIQEAIKRNKTMAFQISSYIDLQTGIVRRQESKITSNFHNPDSNQMSVSISQILDS
jgi:hypothetical protein